MDYIVVTVRTQNDSHDLELPTEVPLFELAENLASIFKLPQRTPTGQSIRYQLMTLPARHTLDRNKTLDQAGIVTGRILALLPIDSGLTYIKTASGREFALDRPEKQLYSIGRSGGSQRPDIDLGQEPQGDTVSRMHAQLYQQGGQWYLVSVAANNTTQIDDVTLVPNQQYQIRAEAKIKLGDLCCTFHTD